MRYDFCLNIKLWFSVIWYLITSPWRHNFRYNYMIRSKYLLSFKVQWTLQLCIFLLVKFHREEFQRGVRARARTPKYPKIFFFYSLSTIIFCRTLWCLSLISWENSGGYFLNVFLLPQTCVRPIRLYWTAKETSYEYKISTWLFTYRMLWKPFKSHSTPYGIFSGTVMIQNYVRLRISRKRYM